MLRHFVTSGVFIFRVQFCFSSLRTQSGQIRGPVRMTVTMDATTSRFVRVWSVSTTLVFTKPATFVGLWNAACPYTPQLLHTLF